MIIKVCFTHPEAKLPVKAHRSDACYDLFAVTENSGLEGFREYGTGVSLEIPDGWYGLIYPRSSVSNKGLFLANSVGVIDSSYRGEIKLRFYYNAFDTSYSLGDRIGQITFARVPDVTFEPVGELTTTARGTGGFGSTNAK